MITITSLVKIRSNAAILDDLSLTVARGEVAVIIGPSGGGKSTLLRCINALEPFEGGSVTVEDITLIPESSGKPARRDVLELRRKVGMVFQQFNLFPHMSILANVTAGPLYALGTPRAEAEVRARELLKRVGLADKEKARPAQLSGGQQQRVAIARALAVNPKAILFDEPTSALDPKMADEVLGVMTDLARGGQTMIVVTHAMSFARRAASKIVVLNAGKVAESGPPEQIFSHPREEVTRSLVARSGA